MSCRKEQDSNTLATWLNEANSAVVFTGAGMSTESGIPDFRSPTGIWAKYKPVYFNEFLESAEARHEHWRQKAEGHREFAQSKPNIGHRIVAKWETRGRIRGVITQNIDGLHQLAGNQYVLELHGTAREAACLTCESHWPADPLIDQFLKTDVVPSCDRCGGLMKIATVSFGQSLPEDVFAEARVWADHADLFIVLGSSLVVEPAASLPRLAKRSNAKLVIVNRDPTPLDHAADVVVRESIGQTLQAVEEDWQAMTAK